MRFYLVAMIFIIFDIEIVFLYPWAVIFRQLGTFGLVEVVVFAAVVFVSFLFLVSNGALTWGPAKRWSAPCRRGARTRPSPASRRTGEVPADVRRRLPLSRRPGRCDRSQARPRTGRSPGYRRPAGRRRRAAPWVSRISSTTS